MFSWVNAEHSMYLNALIFVLSSSPSLVVMKALAFERLAVAVDGFPFPN
jgi:hypothetical protein